MGLPPNSRKISRQKPFQPAPGKDFEIESAPTIEARTKGFFLRAVVLAALAALSTTGIYGLYYHQFGPLQGTWVVVGPIVGAIVNHYFGGHRRDSE